MNLKNNLFIFIFPSVFQDFLHANRQNHLTATVVIPFNFPKDLNYNFTLHMIRLLLKVGLKSHHFGNLYCCIFPLTNLDIHHFIIIWF